MTTIYHIIDQASGDEIEEGFTLREAAEYLLTADGHRYEIRQDGEWLSLWRTSRSGRSMAELRGVVDTARTHEDVYAAVVAVEDWDGYSAIAVDPRRWNITEDGAECGSVEADTLDEALDLARDLIECGNSGYDLRDGPVHATYYVTSDATGARGRLRITWQQLVPDCESGEDHDWQSPHAIVGGICETPGVHGHGGGVIIRECCARCGMYRITDTWAQDPATGEVISDDVITYEDADERSLAWVEEMDCE